MILVYAQKIISIMKNKIIIDYQEKNIMKNNYNMYVVIRNILFPHIDAPNKNH